MKHQILRVRKTHNVRQLKKYVDEAIEKGAETVYFDFNTNNPYFVFNKDFTPEEELELRIKNLKKNYETELAELESRKYKTHSFRIELNLSILDTNNLIENFKVKNKIENLLHPEIKQVIKDKYDDFEDNKNNVFITEILK